MKGGVLGLNSWKFPFILFVLIFTTVVLGWQKAPFFTSILPSRSQYFQISPGILIASPVPSTSPEKHDNNLPTSLSNETLEIHGGPSMAISDPLDSAKGTAETDNKAFSSGIPVTSLPSEKEMLMADNSATLKRDGKQNKVEEPALIVEVKNVSANSPVQVSTRGSGSADERKGVPVLANSPSLSVVPASKIKKGNTTNQKKQSCNYARGKWVADERRPFYSGSSCKQWLSGMWACRLAGRTDFAYEKFRWQPFDCDMEEFNASKFLERMRDKTLAFIGDSLGRQQFQSLMCMLTGGKQRDDVKNVGWEYGLVKGPHAIRPDGWAHCFPSTNTTILFYWSSCLTDLEPLNKSDPHTEYAMHLDRPPSFLRRFINRFDVLVLNTGHHWNRGKIEGNRWVMYVDGAPNTDKNIADIRGAKNFTLHSVIRWVESQLQHYPNLKPFFRSMSPRHFFNGDWNTGGTCDNTSPLSKGKEVIKNDSSDPVSAEAVKGTKVKFLDITAISNLRDEAHISRYSIRPTPGMEDCLHWCMPGIPDTWNELLFAQI